MKLSPNILPFINETPEGQRQQGNHYSFLLDCPDTAVLFVPNSYIVGEGR